MGKTALLVAAFLFAAAPFYSALGRELNDFGWPQELAPVKPKPAPKAEEPTGDEKATVRPRPSAAKVPPVDPPGLKVGDMWRDPVSGIEFMWVPGGTFTMGCSGAWAGECDGDEKPARRVTLRGFWLGRTEVTQAQWERVMGNNPSHFKGVNLPVEQVSWDDAQAFIQKLNGRGNGVFRLPSESQWEYACRSGGKEELYCGGEDADGLAWFRDNSNQQTHPVASKRANGLGLYEMSGNVWEWVADCYVDNYRNAPSDGSAVSGSNSCLRVYRGGSRYDNPRYLRSAFRFRYFPDLRSNYLGFRLARTLP